MTEVTAGRIIEILKIWEIPEILDRLPEFHRNYGLSDILDDRGKTYIYERELVTYPDEDDFEMIAMWKQEEEVVHLYSECEKDYPYLFDYYQEKKKEACDCEYRSILMTDIQKATVKRILSNFRGTNIDTIESIEKRLAAIYTDIIGHTPPEEKHTYTKGTDEKTMENLHWTASLDSKYYQDYLIYKAIGSLSEEVERERGEADKVMANAENTYPYIYQYYTLKNRDYLTFHTLREKTFELEREVDMMLRECKEPTAEKLELINEKLGYILDEEKKIPEKAAEDIKKPVNKKASRKSKDEKVRLKTGEVIEIIYVDKANWRYRLSAQGKKQQPLILSPKNKEYLFGIMSFFKKENTKDHYKQESIYDTEEYDTISMVFEKRDPKASHYDNRLREQLRDKIDYELPDKPLQWLKGKKCYQLNGIVFKDADVLEGHSRYSDNINQQEEEE